MGYLQKILLFLSQTLRFNLTAKTNWVPAKQIMKTWQRPRLDKRDR